MLGHLAGAPALTLVHWVGGRGCVYVSLALQGCGAFFSRPYTISLGRREGLAVRQTVLLGCGSFLFTSSNCRWEGKRLRSCVRVPGCLAKV